MHIAVIPKGTKENGEESADGFYFLIPFHSLGIQVVEQW